MAGVETPLARADVPRLYAIADADALAPLPLLEGVKRMAACGLRWIQIRAKRMPDEALFRAARECTELAGGEDLRLWIDDRVDLASLLPFTGVHLGQEDLPAAVARRVVGPATWIGISTHDPEQVARAVEDPDAGLLAVGPVFPTTGKSRPDPVVGTELVRRARARTDKPLIAIGGIDSGNAAAVLAAGADAVAVLGAICRGDVEENCRRLLAATEGGGA